MTKEDVLNIQNLFGSYTEFRKHLKEVILDNVRRVEGTPYLKDPECLQNCHFDMDKELLFAYCKTGTTNIEVVVTPFDIIQNIVVRFKDFDTADAVFNISANQPVEFINNLKNNKVISLTTN
ncbi:MAG: hypothetical protein ACRC0G_07370 [Fusobacteriaceae bacterium]